ncbi:MAG: secondary thiamine-phosphate synthase enzyme YjbQ [Candidatus Omnitrophota bacterium]
METIPVRTGSRQEFVEVSREVQRVVGEKGWQDGVLFLFVPHTTAGILINEHADPDVAEDIGAMTDKMVSATFPYQHSEGNSPGHIKSVLFGSSLYVIVEQGSLQLGTWQGIFFAEFDGPRSRTLWLKFLSSG